MSHLGVDNKFKTKDVVPVVSALLSGKALDAPKEKPKTEKVDGRTKEYKNAVKRMDSGGRRKDGPDCRTKGYRATVARIAARATKNTVEESTQLDEMFSDVDFVIDQLSNSMEHFSEDDFVEFMGDEIKMPPEIASKIFNDYWDLSAQVRNQNAYGWKKWLEKYGIKESVNENPTYRGRIGVPVRDSGLGGLAMTDERLGKMRIMMRNISRFEGVNVLADEISSALSSSEIRELKSLL